MGKIGRMEEREGREGIHFFHPSFPSLPSSETYTLILKISYINTYFLATSRIPLWAAKSRASGVIIAGLE